MLFNFEELYKIAAENRTQYQTNKPFSHIVLDGLANESILTNAHDEFKKSIGWHRFDNEKEKKFTLNCGLKAIHNEILTQCNSDKFVKFLEVLTSIENLKADPLLMGGGLHRIKPGGKLNLHVDFNYHPVTKFDRRLNVLLFLNPEWKEEYGGHLELCDGDLNPIQKILPIFNRMVIFNTTDFSWHGHPEPLKCPEGMSRKSFALYYYSDGRPKNEKSDEHSTIFRIRVSNA